MIKTLIVLVFLAKILLTKSQDDQVISSETRNQASHEGSPIYSFGYGVADTHTGDIKTVWEAKDGDTVKGQYSIIEPDGSMRSVHYSAGPQSGFTAQVTNEGAQIQASAEGRDFMEDKALREYDNKFDFNDDSTLESYYNTNERKRKRHPYESLIRDYTMKKRIKYPPELETGDYTHSITIKHPHDDDVDSESAAESHIGFNFDPNCKKHKIDNKNVYPKIPDFDFRKQKFPSEDRYKNDFEKYVSDSSNISMEKVLQMYKNNDKYKPLKTSDEFDDWSIKNSYHGIPDIPSENLFSDYTPSRPKKKSKPHKKPEFLDVEDLDDYILVPKRKHKKPLRFTEPDEYHPPDDEFDDHFEDENYYRHPRPTNQKEIVRKVVKKKKPVINILDIFDI